MRVTPAKWMTGDPKPVIWLPDGGGLIVECTINHPPSSEGRKVWLVLEREDADRLLLEIRAEAIHARQRPEPAKATGSSEGFT